MRAVLVFGTMAAIATVVVLWRSAPPGVGSQLLPPTTIESTARPKTEGGATRWALPAEDSPRFTALIQKPAMALCAVLVDQVKQEEQLQFIAECLPRSIAICVDLFKSRGFC